MRRALLAALFVFSACSKSGTDANNDGIADGVYAPNDVTVVAPSTPVGNISGLVLDADGAPLAGVSVTASLAGVAAATTDSTGAFSFKGQPAGSVVGLTLAKSGYTTAFVQTTIPSAAGNVPIDNATANVGPVQLFATTGSLTVNVVGYDGKLLSPNAVLQVSPAFLLDTNGVTTNGGWTVSKATGADGTLSFTGIPDLAELGRLTSGALLSIAVDPLDADGNGSIDYGGATLQLTVEQALSSPGSVSVVLPAPSQGEGDLAIVGSSCGTLVSTASGGGGPAGSQINPTDTVYVAFNQPVTQGSLSVEVLDDDGTVVAVTPNLAGDNTVLSFTGSFSAGHALSVTIGATASASRPAVAKTFTGVCFVTPTEASPTLVHVDYSGPSTNSALNPGEQLSVEFDSSLGYEGGAPQFAAYIDADTDGDGKQLSLGEYNSTPGVNNNPGFVVTVDPSKPSALGGRFSRFFVFTYAPGGVTPLSLGTSPTKAVYFSFDDARNPGSTPIEWVNGTALTSSDPIKGYLVPTQ